MHLPSLQRNFNRVTLQHNKEFPRDASGKAYYFQEKQESVKHKKGHCAGVENKNFHTKRDKDILWDHKTAAATLCNSYFFLYVIRTAIKNKEAVQILCGDGFTDSFLGFLSQHQTFEFV